MADYDFRTLNSTDLEDLARDLMNAQEKTNNSLIVFRTYSEGKDRGIDFRYSTSGKDNAIVGQVKHYLKSEIKVLLSQLQKVERLKVINLNPDRYIFVTSLDLTVFNAEEIRDIFKPFLALEDIYGKSDLNRLLEGYPEILSSHFKLWYSSTNVLLKLLRYNAVGRSNEFQRHELKRKLRLYVPTPTLSNARNALVKYGFVIITGEPGVGKTTTAELLVYELIKDDYELGYLYTDIREIEDIWKDDDSKQVFYFDDFLGHNRAEMTKAQGSETYLLKTLRRVSNAKNKKFVFTTRTFIFNGAIEDSERLRQFNIKTKESIFQLTDYSISDKIHLLDNHIEESEIQDELKSILKTEEIKNFIVEHPNFSPRSIEFITSRDRVEEFSANQFKTFIKSNFNKPDEIWKHAYEQQISEFDQLLLNTMMSLGDSVDLYSLQNAFNARLDYEVRNNNLINPINAFHRSFKKLESGFIVQEYIEDPYHYKFINPSLVDFLNNYILNNPREFHRISESAIYVSQLTHRFFPIDGTFRTYQMSDNLLSNLLNKYNQYIRSEEKSQDTFTLILLAYFHINLSLSKNLICKLLIQIEDWSFLEDEYVYTNSLKIILNDLSSKELIDTFKAFESKFYFNILTYQNDVIESLKFINLVEKYYKSDFQEFIRNNISEELEDRFTDMLNQKIEDDIDALLLFDRPQSFVDLKELEADNVKNRLLSLGIKTSANFSQFGDHDWKESD